MTEHDTLPLPDYDHLPIGGLTSRIRTLDEAGVQTLLEYERAHGNRLPVVEVLQNRLTALKEGAQPSGGNPNEVAPEAPPPPAGGSQVSEATSGPPMNPPSHGDPTNPAQPRSTG
jgi:hypothetical protein